MIVSKHFVLIRVSSHEYIIIGKNLLTDTNLRYRIALAWLVVENINNEHVIIDIDFRRQVIPMHVRAITFQTWIELKDEDIPEEFQVEVQRIIEELKGRKVSQALEVLQKLDEVFEEMADIVKVIK